MNQKENNHEKYNINLSEINQELERLSKSLEKFPIEVFPKQVQEIIIETNDKLGYPNDFIASSILVATSIAIGSRIQVSLKEGFNAYCNIYMILVGPSGSCKSHPMSWALKPIEKIDKANYEIYKKQRKQYELEKSTQLNELPSPPRLKKHLVSNITFEALTDVIDKNPNGIGVFVDEIAGWFKNFDRYNNGSEIESWLSIWSNKPLIIDRKNSEPVFIETPFVSVLGSIQNGIIKELGKNNKAANGFMERLLINSPSNLEKYRWNEKELDIEISKNWDSIINNIFSIKVDCDEMGNIKTKIIPFSKSALKEIIDWQNKISNLCKEYDDEEISSLYAKVDQHALKFCLILQVLECVCSKNKLDVITTEVVKKATLLAEFFAKNSLKAKELMEANNPIKHLNQQKQDLYNALENKFSTKEGFKTAQEFSMEYKTYERFIGKKDLFKREKQGIYTKLY